VRGFKEGMKGENEKADKPVETGRIIDNESDKK
jgi:sec-independent protein translocase protein TatA